MRSDEIPISEAERRACEILAAVALKYGPLELSDSDIHAAEGSGIRIERDVSKSGLPMVISHLPADAGPHRVPSLPKPAESGKPSRS